MLSDRIMGGSRQRRRGVSSPFAIKPRDGAARFRPPIRNAQAGEGQVHGLVAEPINATRQAAPPLEHRKTELAALRRRLRLQRRREAPGA